VVTHAMEDVYIGVSHASHPKRTEFQHSPILGVLLQLCLHLLTKKTTKFVMVTHSGRAYGRGVYLGSLVTRLHLHTRVMWFDS